MVGGPKDVDQDSVEARLPGVSDLFGLPNASEELECMECGDNIGMLSIPERIDIDPKRRGSIIDPAGSISIRSNR